MLVQGLLDPMEMRDPLTRCPALVAAAREELDPTDNSDEDDVLKNFFGDSLVMLAHAA